MNPSVNPNQVESDGNFVTDDAPINLFMKFLIKSVVNYTEWVNNDVLEIIFIIFYLLRKRKENQTYKISLSYLRAPLYMPIYGLSLYCPGPTVEPNL